MPGGGDAPGGKDRVGKDQGGKVLESSGLYLVTTTTAIALQHITAVRACAEYVIQSFGLDPRL